MILLRKYRYLALIIGGIIIGAASIFFLFDHLKQQTQFTQSQMPAYQPGNPTLVVGFDDSFPPYEYLKDGVPTGYNIEIMNAVARVSGYNVRYVGKAWGQILDDLNQGSVDVLSGMFVSETRKATYAFSTPHNYVSSGLFTLIDSDIQNLDDLKGKNVLVQDGDIMEDFVREQQLDVKVISVEDPDEVLRLLADGKADAALLSSISQGEYFKTSYGLTNLAIHNIDLPARAYAFSALKRNQGIIDKLEEGLTLIKSTGEFDAINTKWFFTYKKNGSLATLRAVTYGLLILVFLLIISFIWSRSLKKQVDLKTADLFRSEAKFRAIFQNASEGIGIIYDGKIIFANPRAREILEIEDEPLESIDFFSIPHPSEQSRIKHYYKSRLEGINIPNQYTYKAVSRKSQQERWLINNVMRTTWDNKDVLLVFFNDITDLHTSEAALERSEERLKLALEASNDGIWDFNILAGESYFSPRYYAMLGYTMTDFPASFKSWINLLHPEDRAKTIKSLNKLLDAPDGDPHELTFRMRTKEGSYRWILSKFKITAFEQEIIPKRISGIHTDITRKKEDEETIRKERDVLELIMSTSNNAIFVTDKEGIINYINQTTEQLLGHQNAEIIGKKYTEISIHILDPELTLLKNPGKLLEVVQTSDTPVYNLERIIKHDEKEYHVLLNAAKLLDANKNFDGMVVSMIDITDIRQANEKIKQMNMELEERIHERTMELERKNQELETFTYTVSHDLKAPLRGIDGYSRLLMDEFQPQLNSDAQYFLQTIRNSTLHMEKLINDLLTYSRMERRGIALKEVDIDELIKRILTEYITDLHKTTLILDLKITKVFSDYESLMQILRNLIDNAFKFARKGVAHQVEISSYEQDSTCIIKIKDNGIGFDNKYNENIFRIFNRLHNQDEYPGTGIGLTIVKKGVERINGKISAVGWVNDGAEFTIAIPQLNKGVSPHYDI